jgi:hypothetical protein
LLAAATEDSCYSALQLLISGTVKEFKEGSVLSGGAGQNEKFEKGYKVARDGSRRLLASDLKLVSVASQLLGVLVENCIKVRTCIKIR